MMHDFFAWFDSHLAFLTLVALAYTAGAVWQIHLSSQRTERLLQIIVDHLAALRSPSKP